MANLNWNEIKKKYPIGLKVEGTIIKVWTYGALIRLDDGVTGIVRNREISWDQETKDASKILREGKRKKVSILNVNSSKKQIIFSIRLAVYDPWEKRGNTYIKGKLVRGKIALITKTNAIVEFDDHNRARLPSEEIVPWKIGAIEEILEQGDFIEAKVKSIDENARDIILSMKERLKEIENDLTNISNVGPIELSKTESSTNLIHENDITKTIQEKVRKFDKILVVDNEEIECLQIESMLDDLGYEDVDIETDFDEAIQAAINKEYDLILMDVNKPGDAFAGIRAAEAIRDKMPEVLIVLVTGDEVNWQEFSIMGQKKGLSGMILKPIIFEKLATTMASLEKMNHTGWQALLDRQSQRSVEFVKNISKAAAIRRPLNEVLGEILEHVVEVTKSDRAAIFSMDPQTFHIEMLASIKIPSYIFNRMRFILKKSPVNDVIYGGEHFLENNVDNFIGKFRYLRQMVNFKSCIGIPITGSSDGLGYGLFIFHKYSGHFIPDDLIKAEATASIIGRAIREHWVIKQVADDQRLTLLGGTIASIGHELRGRVGAFEAVRSMSRSWKQLKDNPGKLSDSKFIEIVENNLRRLEAARDGMIMLMETFLGTIRKDQEQVADVKNCLQSVIRLVAHRAATARIELVSKLDWVPPAKGNRVELEQVFMNILLNAIEQIMLSLRQRGKIKIETDCYPADHFPIKIRFIDTGPGIHSRQIKNIFEPMYTTKSKGTGMGLYICRELLALMGGRIKVEKTAILMGTTFLVELEKAK